MRDAKLLLELAANPEFGPYIRSIMEQRPIIPPWTRVETSADNWIYCSGLQAGFDIFASFFEGDLNE